MKKFAFTLAEIMIVSSVIAIITAILLPSARNAMPNEDLMKFKKGHLVLVDVIQELVNSDKYYLNGDLGIRPNNALINGKHDGDDTYFCETFADVLGGVKEKTCQNGKKGSGSNLFISSTREEQYVYYQNILDIECKTYSSENNPAEIITTDNISYFRASPHILYGMTFEECHIAVYGSNEKCIADNNCNMRYNKGHAKSKAGTGTVYNVFCMDIDGMNQGEPPFGYGIREDGKIYYGGSATKWYKKVIQEKI